MNSIVYRLSLAVALSVFMFSCINEKDDEYADISPGDVIPDFEVMMNDGTVVTDDLLKSGPSCIVFFHTSCPDCRSVLPFIQRLYDEFGPEGVRFAIISRDETEDTIGPFWEKIGFTMPYSAQSDRTVYELFAKTRVPRVYISDVRGVVKAVFTDNPTPGYDDLVSVLNSICGIGME